MLIYSVSTFAVKVVLSPFYRRSWDSKIKTFPWGHTARRRQSWSFTPGLSNANALISVSHQQSVVVVSSKQVHRLTASHCPDLTELVASDPFCHSVLRSFWWLRIPLSKSRVLSRSISLPCVYSAPGLLVSSWAHPAFHVPFPPWKASPQASAGIPSSRPICSNVT